jgi:hypothetical protein
MSYVCPFTEADMDKAFRDFGANCGPAALAFALQVHIDKVRDAIPGFRERGYTSPSMMQAALANLRKPYTVVPCSTGMVLSQMFAEQVALVRVQFTGPWTEPWANRRWAYQYTHWISAWQADLPMVFDCNGGIRPFPSWESDILPLLAQQYKRADGGWVPTHIWRLT